MPKSCHFTRRNLLRTAAVGAVVSLLPVAPAMAGINVALPNSASPVPLGDVRLTSSPYLTAVEANLRYLLSLSADRFLHNYHKFAGLPVKGEIYGGWESDSIAGEGLGHYLSALALMHAQTGNAECKIRIDYIVAELTRVQAAQKDGYVAGIMRKRADGTLVDGKEIFAEIVAGDIRSSGFDLNGAWSPLYSLHKVFAGLLDAHALAGNRQALRVAVGFAGFINNVFAKLNDEQVEKVLSCEYGGLNESFAELYARSHDVRWLTLAKRIYDHRALDPIVAGRDELSNFHANTQIPKVIGLARIAELDDEKKQAFGEGSRFFWQTVTDHHSFVIGGNSDREYFFQPDTIADHITEQTCEHCNSYNMLKLTRHLFSWQPNGALFDYYERTHLNHILAAQNPKTGMFAYMMPMMAGAARGFSDEENSFWCCVLTGMESHAKHGDSIYWQSGNTLLVNLYIPSEMHWRQMGAEFELVTRYPYDGRVALRLNQIPHRKRFTVAIRVPAWVREPQLSVNGKPAGVTYQRGYALIHRRWQAGDELVLDMPLNLRLEAASGDERVVSVLRGPMVLSADLGSAEEPFDGVAPALVGTDLLAGFLPVAAEPAVFRTQGIVRPGDVTFKPFYAQHERRGAPYFRRYTAGEWTMVEAAYLAEQARLKDIAARSVDVLHIGEMQPERDHNLQAEQSYPGSYRGRNCRDVRFGGYLTFDMKTTKDDGKPVGPLALSVTYWGSERGREFDILIDGALIAHQVLSAEKPNQWLDIEYPIPEALTKGKRKITVRFEPRNNKSAGPVFGIVLFAAAA